MTSPQDFSTHTLSHHPRGEAITRILSAAIRAVEPGAAVNRFVQRKGQVLLVDGQAYPLDTGGRILILGLGKAAYAMTLPLAELLADACPRGLLIPKRHPGKLLEGFDIHPGGHPIPNEASLQAGEKAMQLVQGLTQDDLLICLISGGGSALMSAPHPGISVSDLKNLNTSLLACGARVDEINTLRRHLDRLKGGGLARQTYPARVVSLILSDVVGNPLEGIASGPTAPDPSSRADAMLVLEKYQLLEKVPASIPEALRSAPETAKPGDIVFEAVQNVLVGSNQLAADAALEQAEDEGFSSHLLGTDWQGEAREVAQELCRQIKESNYKRPYCLIAGGETTVSLHGRGKGGRNQEFALAVVQELAGMPDVVFVTLATDGEDGPTDAAGAVVSSDTLRRGQALGLSAEVYLDDNDSYSYFDALGDLLKPGSTGTNVNDLIFCFGF